MMSKNWELHAVVSGRVQKVGFRATTKRLADALHLVGTVRNLSDGTVAICAQGARETLQLFLTRLSEAFPKDSIQEISVSFAPQETQLHAFEIL